MLVVAGMAGAAATMILLEVPLAIAISLSAIIFAWGSSGTPVQVLTIQMSAAASNFLLLAIPLFVFASRIMEAGGLAADLFRLAEILVGGIRGGLGVSVIVASMFFSGMTGAKVAEIAAITQTTVEPLRRRHYSREHAVAIVLAGSAAGELVPPAINMLIVGATLNTSVTKLFAGGLSAALLLGFLAAALIMIRGDKQQRVTAETPGDVSSHGAAVDDRAGTSVASAVRGGILAAFLPLLVFGGILEGVFSPTEAAGVACVYAMLMVMVVYRRVTVQQMFHIAVESAVLSGGLMLLVISASAFSEMLSAERLQFLLATALHGIEHSRCFAVLLSVALFIVMGSVLEGLPAVIIFAPILAPIAAAAGMDPVQFGVLVVAAIGLGLCLPPVGIGFVTACTVGKTQTAGVTGAYWPFVIALTIGVLLIGFVPAFSILLASYVR